MFRVIFMSSRKTSTGEADLNVSNLGDFGDKRVAHLIAGRVLDESQELNIDGITEKSLIVDLVTGAIEYGSKDYA